MPIEIHPRKLVGPWKNGFALDYHTSSSTFIGYNAFGHPVFDTERPPIGDLLYRLKNRGDLESAEPIAEAAAAFIQNGHTLFDLLVPVPPSKVRVRQPVIEVATRISSRLSIPLCGACISRVKNTGQLKDVFDRASREKLLVDAFAVDKKQTAGRKVLLFDDLYRSGATAAAITRLLLKEGAAAEVYLLTLTQTRKNLR